MPATKISNQVAKMPRVDGWNNLLTMMGKQGHDKRMSTVFSAKTFMDEQQLTDLYVDDGMGKLLVDLMIDDAMREGFQIEGDPEGLVQSKIEEIEGFLEIERLLKWDRLFGGAVMILGVDDGSSDLEQPLNINNIRSLEFLRTYDRYRVNWTTADLYNDPKLRKHGKVAVYNVWPVDGLASYRVHETRCIVLPGMDIPEQARRLNQGWGTSFLQHCYEQMRDLGDAYGGLGNIIQDFVFGTLSINNLQEMIAAGQESFIKARLELMDLSRHVINTVLLDEKEVYEKHASTVSGLSDIMDKFYEALSMVSGYPIRKLKGDQGGGLNNEGTGVTKDYYDRVSSYQENRYKAALNTVSKIIMKSSKGPFSGTEPKDWKIKFNPLFQLTEKEEAEVKKLNSESDCNYVNAGVLDPVEVAESRFGGDTYGEQIVLSVVDRESLKEEANPEPVQGTGAQPKPTKKAGKSVKP
jgi:uncharacterized protein